MGSDALRALLDGETTPEAFRRFWPRVQKEDRGFISKLRPWAWFGEITRGCNLRCGFCAARLLPHNQYKFLEERTWRDLLEIMAVVSPCTRLEIGNCGEQSMHPQLYDLLRLARERLPHVQILMYTNGTTLMNGHRTYKQLFDAGLNVAYVNLYFPFEQHRRLAEASGYPWLYEGKRPGSGEFISPFEYRAGKDPNFHLINFCRNPGYWSKQRRHRHGFSTFYNHLDWPAAAEYGLTPVTQPLARRCDFPLKYPAFEYTGKYLLCCWDFTGETAGTFGSVHDGLGGFLRYWFGESLQRTRRLHYAKDRASHPICSRCGTVSHRGDIPWWEPAMFDHCWTGERWQPL